MNLIAYNGFKETVEKSFSTGIMPDSLAQVLLRNKLCKKLLFLTQLKHIFVVY